MSETDKTQERRSVAKIKAGIQADIAGLSSSLEVVNMKSQEMSLRVEALQRVLDRHFTGNGTDSS